MKINRQALLSALSKLASFTKRGDEVHILDIEEGLALYCYSRFYEVSAETVISQDFTNGSWGKAKRIDFQELLKSTKNFTADELDFSFIEKNDNEILEIKSSEFKVGLLTGQSEYVPYEKIEGKLITIFSAERLSHIFKTVVYSVKKFKRDDIREIFNHVHFYQKDKNLVAGATDSYSLAKFQDETTSDEEFELLVPEIVAKNISKCFESNEDVKIYDLEKRIIFESDKTMLKFKKCQREYPDLNRVIPARDQLLVQQLDLKQFDSALKRMLKISGDWRNNAVATLIFKNDKVRVLDSGIGFSFCRYEQEIDLLESGADLKISANPYYLIDIIKNLPKNSKVVRLMIESNVKPFLIESDVEDEVVRASTPIRNIDVE